MVDGLRQALARIYLIPKPILEAAFEPFEMEESLDEIIKQKVLLARVRDDISLRGGRVFRLLMDMNWCKFTTSPSPYALGISGSYSTYVIPPEAREHRDISAVLNVRFPYTLGTSSNGSFYNDASIGGNTVGGLACAALNAQTGAGLLTCPQGLVRPGNVIQLDPPQYNFVPWQVNVRLRYDDNFSGMDVSLVQPFAVLCEHAVKAYIYSQLIFKIESNMMYRGMELGIFREIVTSYADANEKYDEQLLQVGGAEILEPERLKGILTRMIPKR